MRKLIIIGLLTFAIVGALNIDAQAQQVYQFTQYQQNLYILNSASAGVHNYLDINLSYRNQWVGMDNSPTTYYVSANMPLGQRLDVHPQKASSRISSPSTYNSIPRSPFHSVGFFAAQDSYGPYSLNIVSASYSFHLPMAKELTLSFSPNVSFNSVSFDPNKAVVEYPGDPTYANYLGSRNQSSQLDINVAFWLYHNDFFVGYSSDQLVQDKLKLTSEVTLEQIKAHHNLIGGYKFVLNGKLALTPSVMVKYVSQAPINADVNVRLDIEERYWAGITYRSSNSLSGMLGVYLNNTVRLGYSFDLTLSTIQLRNAGSHELFLGLNIFNKEKAIF
jgi:type IX secretion system PorP/SprF family membrane protein